MLLCRRSGWVLHALSPCAEQHFSTLRPRDPRGPLRCSVWGGGFAGAPRGRQERTLKGSLPQSPCPGVPPRRDFQPLSPCAVPAGATGLERLSSTRQRVGSRWDGLCARCVPDSEALRKGRKIAP